MRPALAFALAALLACAGCMGGTGPAGSAGTTAGEETTTATTAAPAETTTARTTASGETTTQGLEPRDGMALVTIRDENGTRLGVVNATISDTNQERYTGLSDHESLANGTGMLFVYRQEDDHTYVMRRMDFPLDIVYVDANGTITRIHHAPVENDSDLTPYPGHGQWVLEVPMGWTTARGIETGDEVRIGYPANATVTPTPTGQA